ncbi:hypothetical protein EVAR_27294_1 [Eumeta japonica]|uniref:Uncharacterized protein n=1 Tax=Eumeta variegata TaxID=151549 RepID=A0A4C1UCA4_EUMVA|nr:hypothetical protein EVAR_27294_1 [Eumeta japonica]
MVHRTFPARRDAGRQRHAGQDTTPRHDSYCQTGARPEQDCWERGTLMYTRLEQRHLPGSIYIDPRQFTDWTRVCPEARRFPRSSIYSPLLGALYCFRRSFLNLPRVIVHNIWLIVVSTEERTYLKRLLINRPIRATHRPYRMALLISRVLRFVSTSLI